MIITGENLLGYHPVSIVWALWSDWTVLCPSGATAKGERLPVRLSALIAPHLVPVCSFTGLLPCPSQHAHSFPSRLMYLFALRKHLQLLSHVLLQDTMKEFVLFYIQRPTVTMWSSLSLDEIRWNFNGACGAAGLLQLRIIRHSLDKVRYKQMCRVVKGLGCRAWTAAKYNFSLILKNKKVANV